METYTHSSAVSLNWFNFLVVPPLRCTSGAVYSVYQTPAFTCLAAEGANEINSKSHQQSPA